MNAEQQQLRADVIAYLTASAHADAEALQAAYDALVVHPAVQIFSMFTALVFVAGADEPMDYDGLLAFLARMGLGAQRSALGLAGPPGP